MDTGAGDEDELLDEMLLRRLRAEPWPSLPTDYQRRPGRPCEVARAFRYADQGRLLPAAAIGFCHRHRPHP